MTEPMTPEEARMVAHQIENSLPHHKDEIPATLRAYADMLDRQTVDRESLRDSWLADRVAFIISDAMDAPHAPLAGTREKALNEATDAILALIQPAVKVKALEWVQDGAGDCYTVHATAAFFYEINLMSKDDRPFWLTPFHTGATEYHPTLEAAKTAAQAHYDAAIREALEPDTGIGLAEREEQVDQYQQWLDEINVALGSKGISSQEDRLAAIREALEPCASDSAVSEPTHVTETPKTEHTSELCYSGKHDDMVMVPRNLTAGMILAANAFALTKHTDTERAALFAWDIVEGYSAMLSAAPTETPGQNIINGLDEALDYAKADAPTGET